MLAVLSTLIFASVLWLVAAVVLRMADESGHKVLAALKGLPLASEPQVAQLPVRVRYRPATQSRPVRARARLRAAA